MFSILSCWWVVKKYGLLYLPFKWSVDGFTWFMRYITWFWWRHNMACWYIYVLYDGSYEGLHLSFTIKVFTLVLLVFTRVLRCWLRSYKAPIDGPMERQHSGLDICDGPHYGVVDGVLTTVVWGGVGMPQHRRVGYPDQYQCQARYICTYTLFTGFLY